MEKGETCRKIKAVLIIAMVANADVRQIHRDIRFTTGLSSTVDASTSTRGLDAKSGTSDGVDIQAMMADTKLLRKAQHVATQLEELVADPALQEQVKAVSEHVKAVMADANFEKRMAHALEQISATGAGSNDLQDLARAIAKQMEAVMADPDIKAKARVAAEQVEAMIGNSQLQAQIKDVGVHVESILADMALERDKPVMEQPEHLSKPVEMLEAMMASPRLEGIAAQVEAAVSDPHFKEQATRMAETVRSISADPSFKEQGKLVLEQMEALMSDPASPESMQGVAKQIEALIADPKLQHEAHRISEQMEEMMAEAHFEERVGRITQDVEAMLAETNLQGLAQVLAEQMTGPNVHEEPAELAARLKADQVVDRMVDKLFDGTMKARARRSQSKPAAAALDKTTVGKLGLQTMGLVKGEEKKPTKLEDIESSTGDRSTKQEQVGIGVLAILGGMMFHVAAGSMYTTGNLVPYMPAELRYWGGAAGAGGLPDALQLLPITIVAMPCAMPFGAMLEKRFGPKITMMIASVFMFLGVFLASFARHLVPFALAYSVLFGFGVGLGYQVPFLTGGRWFPKVKATVVGAIIAGFGASAFFFNILDMKYVNPHGVQAIAGVFPEKIYDALPGLLRLLAVMYGVLAFCGALLQHNPPSFKGDYPKWAQWLQSPGRAASESSRSRGEEDGPSPSPSMATMAKDLFSLKFLTLWIMIFTTASSGLNIAGSFKIYGQTLPALNSDVFLTFVGSLSALLGNGCGRLFWGSMSDIAGFRPSFLALTLIESLTMINFKALARCRSTFAMATTIMLFCTGGCFAMFPPEVHRLFHPHGPVIYGFMYTAFAAAGVLGPLWSKALMKQGGYELIFKVFGFFTLIASAITLILPPEPLLTRAFTKRTSLEDKVKKKSDKPAEMFM